jgi:hypothetical protein
MSATVRELQIRTTPPRETNPKEVVAVILADGSVRELRGRPGRNADGHRHTAGTLSGRDWILWWERRAFR